MACWPSPEINSTCNLQPLSQLFFNRRESPWKVDVESSGVPAKLRLLEQELINLEKVVNGDLSKIPLVMRKQVKRYQTLAGKIDDLCKRMVGLLIWNSIYLLSCVLLLNAKYLIYHSIVHFPGCKNDSCVDICLYDLYLVGIIWWIHGPKIAAVSSRLST